MIVGLFKEITWTGIVFSMGGMSTAGAGTTSFYKWTDATIIKEPSKGIKFLMTSISPLNKTEKIFVYTSLFPE